MARRLAAATGVRTTMLARSGSRIGDVEARASRLPADATHLIVSAGGNDLLDIGRRLREEANDAKQLDRVVALLAGFEQAYARLCRALAARSLPTAICAIYAPPIADPELRRVGAAALRLTNGAINALGRKHGFDVIDLGAVCRAPEDFADPIHPSATGARKIAAALALWLRH